MRRGSRTGNSGAKSQIRNMELFEQLPQPDSFRRFWIQGHIHAVAMVKAHGLMQEGLTQRAHRQSPAKALLKL